ncbi:MauE/DoxX family redox-associated membrane protein [Cerasicoccus maritimus]|uniref:MauE/DoxX family redox-associated membrane protein n=1 Tax=Cerasicoccus maritimus TaxID=490089 RepID=UPI002852BBC6|nr:MauE/DoxX family redox-associated membrane protein [Cerasicoccus maritimus]
MARTQVILFLLAQMILGALFLYSGIVKMLEPKEFLQSIEAYRLVLYEVAWLTAYYLPPLEILVGLGVFIRQWRRACASLIAVMMLIFTTALILAWARGLDINCGCFGASSEASNYWIVLGRDLILLFLAITVAIYADTKASRLFTKKFVAGASAKPTLETN